MCGNIKKLRFADRDATDEELHKAALQFVRKVANYRKPSASNTKVFEDTVERVKVRLREMLDELKTA